MQGAVAPILSVDGGGSGTRAVLVDGQGNAIWRGRGGPANCRLLTPEQLYEVLDSLYAEALQAAGEAGGAGLGLAGVVDARTAHALERRLATAWKLPEKAVCVESDLRMTFRAAFAGSVGILLIAGTGSSCLGRNAAGRWRQCGGWGPVLDDGGSGYWIGLEALKQVVRAHDGRSVAAGWEEALLGVLGLHDIPGLVGWLHDGADRRREVAALAPWILDRVESGDVAAGALVGRALEELTGLVVAVARSLEMEAPPVVLHGSLAQRLRPALAGSLAAQLPGARLAEARHPAEWGGVLAVRERLAAG